MKLIENTVMRNIENKPINIKYYNLDINVNYSDIGSILEALPNNYSYNGFNLSETEDEGYGYSAGFYNLDEMKKFYYSHADIDVVDLFSFNMIDQNETLSFSFSIGNSLLKAVGNTKTFEMDSFVNTIEQSIINKKKFSNKL